MNHARATVGALLAATLALSACTAGPTEPAGPSGRSATPSPSPSASAGTPAPTTSPFPDPLHASGTTPAVLDPELLARLPLTVVTRTDYARHVFAEWPEVGRPAIDAALTTHVTARVDDFERTYAAPSGGAVVVPELNVGWHLLGSAPTSSASSSTSSSTPVGPQPRRGGRSGSTPPQAASSPLATCSTSRARTSRSRPQPRRAPSSATRR